MLTPLILNTDDLLRDTLNGLGIPECAAFMDLTFDQRIAVVLRDDGLLLPAVGNPARPVAPDRHRVRSDRKLLGHAEPRH